MGATNAFIAGYRFGNATALSDAGLNRYRQRIWNCQCDCGQPFVAVASAIHRGRVRGCARRCLVTNPSKANPRPERAIRDNMIARCHCPTNKSYPRYGGRGIMVCDRWRNSFDDFLADIGPRPSAQHSIDRIDGTKGYEPSNCRWATYTEQARNTRRNHLVTMNGETRCIAEWVELLGVPERRVRTRLQRGWDPTEALTTPFQRWSPRQAVTVVAFGQSLRLCEWADRLGCRPEVISGRVRRGWSAEDAVSKPTRACRNGVTREQDKQRKRESCRRRRQAVIVASKEAL